MSATAVRRMNMNEVRDKAKGIGVIPGKMKKADLIRAIQEAEGYSRCFGYSDGQCAYVDCCFMGDCLKVRN